MRHRQFRQKEGGRDIGVQDLIELRLRHLQDISHCGIDAGVMKKNVDTAKSLDHEVNEAAAMFFFADVTNAAGDSIGRYP
jgi:hypothetical protein